MTTRLESFRNHCRTMAAAEHKPECPMLTWRKPWFPRWHSIYENGRVVGLGWNGPEPECVRPTCDGCNSAEDRALFARMAGEVDDYLRPEVDLFGDLTVPPPEEVDETEEVA